MELEDMILAESKSLNSLRTSIEDSLARRYKTAFETDDFRCFCYNSAVFFRVSEIVWQDTGENAIIAEYADSEFEARKNLFGEDGDMFYPQEMSEAEIVDAIIKEVETED